MTNFFLNTKMRNSVGKLLKFNITRETTNYMYCSLGLSTKFMNFQVTIHTDLYRINMTLNLILLLLLLYWITYEYRA